MRKQPSEGKESWLHHHQCQGGEVSTEALDFSVPCLHSSTTGLLPTITDHYCLETPIIEQSPIWGAMLTAHQSARAAPHNQISLTARKGKQHHDLGEHPSVINNSEKWLANSQKPGHLAGRSHGLACQMSVNTEGCNCVRADHHPVIDPYRVIRLRIIVCVHVLQG